jgi:hypothetical protein
MYKGYARFYLAPFCFIYYCLSLIGDKLERVYFVF